MSNLIKRKIQHSICFSKRVILQSHSDKIFPIKSTLSIIAQSNWNRNRFTSKKQCFVWKKILFWYFISSVYKQIREKKERRNTLPKFGWCLQGDGFGCIVFWWTRKIRGSVFRADLFQSSVFSDYTMISSYFWCSCVSECVCVLVISIQFSGVSSYEDLWTWRSALVYQWGHT